jgi:preprotein translocase subunit SecD
MAYRSRRVPRKGVRRIVPVFACALLVGCGTSGSDASFRIVGEGGIGPVLSRPDLRSARADIDPSTSQAVVLLDLTPKGQRKFLVLTGRVARAGRERRRPAHVIISVNGNVISRPYIDYHATPNGIPADNGIQIDLPSRRAARALAANVNH